MAPHPSAQFVEAAFNCAGGQFQLSYTDPEQKLLIRHHLLSLIQDFPYFAISMDSYAHNDGTVVNLVCAMASLRVSSSAPPVPIIIWVHEDYPQAAPMVFLDSSRLDYDRHISPCHPYVDSSSGSIASPYIHSWEFPWSNLRDLVQNLVHLFSLDHPLGVKAQGGSRSGSRHPSYASKNEAIDRLSGMLHVDVMVARSETDAEVEGLLQLQLELAERAEALAGGVGSLWLERRSLRVAVRDSREMANELADWLGRVDDGGRKGAGTGDVEELFVAADEESETRLGCVAGDKAVEETIYALDEAVSNGTMGFEDYMKQVRMLAREQFSYRAMLLKLDINLNST
ncbi:hypothetical protein MLD38_031835 [Melastoma candidum]|uniref:Uncharacterized protein n=1 Tax=Melastoma candidum TaxID=119954 RepID=A0ACB9MSU9_9MYRT|nr:hypothetical protein MLD38_031835 [Melastoma candidum]